MIYQKIDPKLQWGPAHEELSHHAALSALAPARGAELLSPVTVRGPSQAHSPAVADALSHWSEQDPAKSADSHADALPLLTAHDPKFQEFLQETGKDEIPPKPVARKLGDPVPAPTGSQPAKTTQTTPAGPTRAATPQTTPGAATPAAGQLGGLCSRVTAGHFAAATRLIQQHWAELGPAQRAANLGKAANDALAEASVPAIANQVADTGTATGQFETSGWVMLLSQQTFNQPTLTQDQAATAAGTVYHESRHAEQTHMIGRLLASQGKTAAQIRNATGVPAAVAADAAAKPLTKNSPEAAAATQFQDSMFGPRFQVQTTIVDNLQRKGQERVAAENQYQQLARQPGANPAAVQAARANLDRIAKEWQALYLQYKSAAHEADAYVAGDMAKDMYLSGYSGSGAPVARKL